jgi:uncharacterized membrane protein
METIEKSIEVDAPIQKVYNQWTQFEEFPRFMEGIEEVRQLDNKHLHWVANVGGRTKEWDAEIVEQIPEDRIAWRSTSGARNAGVVHFQSSDPAHTVITLRMDYEAEGTMEKIGSAMGVLSSRVEADLRNFKEFIQRRPTETGSWREQIQGNDESGKGSGSGM